VPTIKAVAKKMLFAKIIFDYVYFFFNKVRQYNLTLFVMVLN
jgi:hypothetical protein